jgi:transposase
MHPIREILRLHYELGQKNREIARAQRISHTTVGDVVRRFEATGQTWPLPTTYSDSALATLLYPDKIGRPAVRSEPDWATIHQEMGPKGVTLQLLWTEYRRDQPDGLGYAQFCEKYRAYRQRVDYVLRKTYAPGEYCFVDYAGPTLAVVDPTTGEVQAGQLFVAVLGYSRYTYVAVHPQQTTGWWIRGHVDAFAYFGGVPRIVVPDNPKPLVTKAERFDVTLNRTYQEFSAHYGVAIIPARVRHPRDKGAVEAAVLLAERWILATLRHERLLGWDAARHRVATLLDALNAHPFQKLPGSRHSLWQEHERAALSPLPDTAFEDQNWRLAKVHPDYHVGVEQAYYSVPYTLVGAQVDVRITTTTVEVFQDGLRVASHPRQPAGHSSTVPAHMPPAHRALQDWTPETFQQRAHAIGPHLEALFMGWFSRARVPQQYFRRCQGVLDLVPRFGVLVVERAADRALQTGADSYRALQAFCQAESVAVAPSAPSPRSHDNVRGSDYYADPTAHDLESAP